MRRALARFANLFLRRNAERELTREIESHLALLQDDFERRGLSPEEAALAARRAYGGIEQAKELHRETRSFLWIEQFFKDLRYGWNNLLRHPGFTLTAVVVLALAIGANTTIFAIYNAVVLKQLPVADPSRVFRLKRGFEHNTSGNLQYNFAYPEYQYLRDHSTVFAALTASSFDMPVLASVAGGAPEHLRGHAVSANYFAALGISANIGRTFLADEDRSPGGNTVVVLGYEFWQRKYRGDPNVIGQTIKLDDIAYTIAGVAPQEFTGTDVIPTESAFWAPISMVRQLNPGLDPVLDHWYPATHTGFQLLARLKNGVSRSQAQAETALLLRQYLATQHESERTTSLTLRRTSRFDDDGFLSGYWQLTRTGLLLVCIVLLAACANVANMQLARGVARQREIAIRLSLGAGRARVVRQLLTESVLLALLGGAAGILVSSWAGRLLWVSLNRGVQMFELHLTDVDFSPDAHLLAYGAALSLLTGILFGLAPALQATRQTEKRGHSWLSRLTHRVWSKTLLPGQSRMSPLLARAALRRSRLRAILLAAQVAVAVLLLSGVREGSAIVAHANASEQGFDTRDTYLLNIHDDDIMGANRRVRERLATLPEVRSVAIGGWPLVGNSFWSPVTAGNLSRRALVTYDSDGYFETMGIPILRGRSFTRAEADHGAPVAVVSEATARHYWPDANPLGQHISLGALSNERSGPVTWQNKFKDYEVIGVARDIRFRDVVVNDPSHIFLPLGVWTQGGINGGVVFRPAADRDKALAAVQSAVESLDRTLLPDMQIMSFGEGPITQARDVDHVVVGVLGTFMLVSLTLAGVGIYGVVAFLVSQRTKEIGIRIALGATSSRVVQNILQQGLLPVSIGIAIGFAVSLWVAATERSAEVFPDTLLHTLFGDPFLYAELSFLVAVIALASILPASRASRVDPVIALRYE